MIYADEALNQLRDCVSSNNLSYELGDINQKVVQLTVNKDGIAICAWFDVEKQLFGFNMLNGGCKTYDNIEDFDDYFVTYIKIFTEFIPKAKAVADKFEEDFHIQTIYDNFVGRKESGYIAVFRVLGNNTQKVRVQDKGEIFIVNLVEQQDTDSKYKILSSYNYEATGSGYKLVVTLDSYIERITDVCNDSEDYDIRRTGDTTFEFDLNGLEIDTGVAIQGETFSYKITNIGGIECNKEFSPSDCYSIVELYNFCQDFFDNFDDSDEAEEESETTEEEPVIEEQEEQEETTEADLEDIPDVGESSEDLESYEESNEIEKGGITEVVVKKILKDSTENTSYLEFVTEDAIYTMSVDKAVSLGIPVERISEIIVVIVGVIPMTTDEKEMHTFSKDISDNDEVCQSLFQAMFA